MNLPSYEAYYNLAWPHLDVDVPPLDATMSCLIWPSYFPTTSAPCLLTWITQRLELPTGSDACVPSYVHLEGVNDLAVALAGMTLAAVYGDYVKQPDRGGQNTKPVQYWLSVWRNHIIFPHSCDSHDPVHNLGKHVAVDNNGFFAK